MNDRIVVDAFLFVPVQAHEVVMTNSDTDECVDGRDYPELFREGKDRTECPTLKPVVGRHVKVHGEQVDNRAARIGTTVRVDETGHVLSKGFNPWSSSDESDDDESDYDESNDSVTEFEVGHAFDTDQPYNSIVRGARNYFGIVWGRYYERVSGFADDEIDEDDYDPHILYYDIVVLGSNSTWSYAEWDNLYESMKEDLSTIVNWNEGWE